MNNLLTTLSLFGVLACSLATGCANAADSDVQSNESDYSVPYKFARQTLSNCQYRTDVGGVGRLDFKVNESEGFASEFGKSHYQVGLQGSFAFTSLGTSAFSTYGDIDGNASSDRLLVNAFTSLHAGWKQRVVPTSQGGAQGSRSVADSAYYALVTFTAPSPNLRGQFELVDKQSNNVVETRSFVATCTERTTEASSQTGG